MQGEPVPEHLCWGQCPTLFPADPVPAIWAPLPPRAPGDHQLESPSDTPGENPPLQVPRPELLMWGRVNQTDFRMDVPMRDSNEDLKTISIWDEASCLDEGPSSAFLIMLRYLLLLTSMFSKINPLLSVLGLK